jgi:transketolase
MRRALDIFLSRYNNPDLYFLHADMWSFPRFKAKYPQRCLNIGVQETNMINIAGGLASQGKIVIVYGVAGFVYQRAYEQLKFSVTHFGKSVILVNAGANGCYNKCGIGHIPDDDYALMDALSINKYEPQTCQQFIRTLKQCIRNKQTNFIRLGWDNCVWK